MCFFNSGIIVSINGLVLLAQTYWMDGPSPSEADNIYAPWVSYFFVGREAPSQTFKNEA